VNPVRVLIVDDDDQFRLAVRALLEQHAQLEVVGEAPNGEAAVKLVPEVTPDLVLMDYEMPRMDGIEATKAVRQLAPATRVVVVSGSDDRELEARAYAAGATHFVPKPRIAEAVAAALALI
jgi:DNA-binding NarL/FixJ family response regulator